MENDTATEILEATHRALCRRGYADLTLGAIADEADRSTSSIHYHFDDKETLLREYLDHLHTRYIERIDAVDGGTSREELGSLLQRAIGEVEPASKAPFRTALLEVKAQAPYDDAVRERLRAFDEFLLGRVEDVIADGIESGQFDEQVDAAAAADFLVTAVIGARTRNVALGHSADVRKSIARYVDAQLVAKEPTEATR
ncbi:TetR/AcrR family transcriptional regulator [Halobellus rufus]|uniref:TetR/AcrR family transcriptional regulator n=1 Tax=Halobellus rufus TaxID=1448860 RepID=UPI000678D9A9|nr:TetR/AcrR family transcriptional regulator [Halobellus rufus]